MDIWEECTPSLTAQGEGGLSGLGGDGRLTQNGMAPLYPVSKDTNIALCNIHFPIMPHGGGGQVIMAKQGFERWKEEWYRNERQE